jgi:hypothetical protein
MLEQMRRALFLLMTGVLLSACLISSNPATGRQASGQRLLVKSESGTGVTTTNDVVGSGTVHHNDGSLSTVELRGDVDHAFVWHTYSWYEGTAAIDEQDFFRLAGDRGSAERVATARAGAGRMQKIGLAIIAGALIIGGARHRE